MASVIAGLLGVAYYLLPARVAPASTLEEALTALEHGDDATARQTAMSVRTDPKLSYREQGGPLFVLGMAIAHDAEKLWNPRERRLLHLVAAKYLQEARNRDFPAGHEAEGALQLGKSWFYAGEPALAIEALHLALENKTPQTAEVRRLLAESYLLVTPPDYTKALAANAAYLAEPGLQEADKQGCALREARIQLALGQLADCRQSLEAIPATSQVATELAIVKGQLLLAEGEKVLADDPTRASYAQALFQQAVETLRSAPQEEIGRRELSASAQYLLGVCFERLGDDDAAEAQYERLRLQTGESPEKVAATLRAADLLLRRKNYDEAVELVLKALADEQLAGGRRNPWMPSTEIERRLGQLENTLLEAKAFAAALELAGMPAGVIPAWQLANWKANTYEAQAAALERDAETAPPARAEQFRAKARADRRRAGREAARLAELRALTNDYGDDLWRSAEQHFLGRDYSGAIDVVRIYLRNESKKRRPDALLMMAEAQLALDQVDKAIETLNECLESFANHPAVYRARLIAAQAYAEKGLLEEARVLLAQNVESDDLSPRSDQWRDSLFLLGNLLHRQGVEAEAKSRAAGIDDEDLERTKRGLLALEPAHLAFREAINQLDKAVERYPDSPQTLEARYLLADSYRQAAKWPRKKLRTVSIEATRAALARQSQLDLEAALAEYDRLIAQLGDVQESPTHTALEKRLLRNSYFSKADALFDLGRYEDAARAYSAASNRYQNLPESLEAYVQIAACYRLLGKPQEARGTLQQAQGVLVRIKPDANFTQATPYSRDEWQQLLKWLASL
jgi:TolA-binding protein